MYNLTNSQYLKRAKTLVPSAFIVLWAIPLLAFPFFFQRSEFGILSVSFFVSVTGYYLYLKIFQGPNSYIIGVIAGALARFVLLFSPVFLSEDVFRFLWDGSVLQEGISPYSTLPKEVIFHSDWPGREELLSKMNSAGYYSVYPPVLQILFLLPASIMKFSGSVYWGVVFWKGIVFLFELSVLLLTRSVTEKRNQSFLIYWLHPLAIWDGVGNGHPEPILIFFLFLSALQWKNKKMIQSGIYYITAVLTKLIPILLLPYFFFVQIRKLPFRSVLGFGFLTILISAAFFWTAGISPDLTFLQKQWKQGIGVYFTLFEYHGGLYYLVKIPMKYTWFPYSAGLLLALLSFLSILTYSFFESQKEEGSSFVRICRIWIGVLGIYYLFSSTIHPWYLLPLLAASAYTGQAWPMAASGIWILSYSTYENLPYRDEVWVIITEHLFVLAIFLYEGFQFSKSSFFIRKNVAEAPPNPPSNGS